MLTPTNMSTRPDVWGEDIISKALWFFIIAQQRSGNSDTADTVDAIGILLAHCGGDLDYLGLRYPGLTVDLRHVT